MELLNGILHETPNDLQATILSNELLVEKWNKLTPIQRNEWICWVITVKKEETRIKHLKRFVEDFNAGKKTPCCWPGCPHRRGNARKWFKNLDS